MKHIYIPYYYDYTKTHYLKIEWIKYNDYLKTFTWYDRLFTIQMYYSKNYVRIGIHNSNFHLIEFYTTNSIDKAIEIIEESLYYVVNHCILKDKFDRYQEHNLYLDDLYYLIR